MQRMTTTGLPVRKPVLANEDPAAYAAVRASFHGDLRPKTPVQEMLVDELAACHWRRLRAERGETALMNLEIGTQSGGLAERKPALRHALALESLVSTRVFGRTHRQSAALSRQFHDVWRRLAGLRPPGFRRQSKSPGTNRTRRSRQRGRRCGRDGRDHLGDARSRKAPGTIRTQAPAPG